MGKSGAEAGCHGEVSYARPALISNEEVRLIANVKPRISSGEKSMIKAGDIFKNIENGKVFTVKSASPSIILLATKDESHSMFVSPDSIESRFVPFVEDEPKRNLKS